MIELIQLSAALSVSYTRALLWIEVEFETPTQSEHPVELQIEQQIEKAIDPLEKSIQKLLETFSLDSDELLLLSDRSLGGLKPISRGEFVRHLGRSYRLIILDAFSGVNPATLAQAIGTLEGGGVLVLLTPPAREWPSYFDPEYRHLGFEPGEQPAGRFIRWLLRGLENSSAVARHSCSSINSTGYAVPELPPYRAPESTGHFLAKVQQQAVYQLLNSWQQPRSCTVFDADRGRGKSSVLGLALALQSSFQAEQLALCAPDKRAVVSIYQRFLELDKDRALPKFYTPAELIKQMRSNPASLRAVLVDEAAGVPLPILEQIAASAEHLVLSSTLHGYEGFARGYGLRFLKQLDMSRPECRRIPLGKPLRWACGDQLEQWVERYLLLAQEPENLQLVDGFYEVQLDDLLDNEQLLRSIYQLLVTAHYRTSPSDLRLLLDAPGQRLFILVVNRALIGVLWVTEEGELNSQLAEQVMQGRRRPNGNLLPQSLLHYLGWEEAGDKQYWRVVRIAVAEQHRRLGYASSMLQSLLTEAHAKGVDFLGASFAGHADLLEFWHSCGFGIVRRGDSVDPVAAEPAVQVLQPVLKSAEAWLESQQHPSQVKRVEEQALQNFAYHFAPLKLVRDQLKQLNLPELLAPILDEISPSNKRLKPLRAWLRNRLEAQRS